MPRPRGPKSHLPMKQEQKHYVAIGQCVVEHLAHRDVRYTLPDGRSKYVPRSILMNPHERRIGNTHPVVVEKWWAVREGIAYQELPERRPREQISQLTSGGEAEF
jgi:hypothetical protein